MVTVFGDLTSVWAGLGAAIAGLIFVLYLAKRIMKKDPGNEKMVEISKAIQQGAMAFLEREYKSIGIFVALLAIILFFAVSKKTAVAFISGAFFSILAGYIGMKVATASNNRTAQASIKSVNEAIDIAFPGGAVMGMSVVALGLLGLSVIYLIFIKHASGHHSDLFNSILEATQLIAGFSMGASSVALFARVGGGIYTKAADVGADLVGKVEAGIPEDDPRNPAVIADNVGDNVGDVAGMGADLYESYVGAIISALVIAAAPNPIIDTAGMMLAFLLAAWGIISSIIGIQFVVVGGSKTDAQKAMNSGMAVSAILLAVGAFLLCKVWYGSLGFFWAVLSGLVAGLIVGFAAQVYTSGKAVREIAEAAQTGPATAIIQGMATAMKSTVIPVIAIAAATIVAYQTAGIFGVALSAIGMLALTGMTVAVDAYGPIADNAAGISEMAHLGPDARKRCEKLDAVGNTTAAIGKGFAIGSAALTALALFTAYSQTIQLNIIDALNATVIAGMFIGGIVPFIFCAQTMQAVGRAAFGVVGEVRRQWKEIPGLMEGTAMPDSAKIVDITTRGALKEMIVPGLMAVILPILLGVLLGKEALGGFLVGSLITGVPLAIFLANAGGAWDNAKKYVEEGNLGGKGSDVHKATVIGDTIGDPFKDTSGPSLNILLKLMAVVSLVFALTIDKIHIVVSNILPFLKQVR
ncbi:MAG: putative K(+)-stimulated pyrophosphate-energized sodium pump [Elusimicrobia bacterium ADurb.Bin231]|nr:MAG: putative K(+)-stimulated pyrophosphate-energized sodium pump [Elusimicrobia bacterium ADurb.Bin231]